MNVRTLRTRDPLPAKPRMQPLALFLLAVPALAQVAAPEAPVLESVRGFYAAFNSHAFGQSADFATDDWNHINPYGGRTNGRDNVLNELNAVHATFLKGVSDNIEKVDVRFASKDVAVATVVSRMSTFTSPDGVRHENERHVRTFVLVHRAARWLIMQDHNTVMGVPPPAR